MKLIHPDDIETCLSEWNKCAQSGIPYKFEYRIKGVADKKYRWFYATSYPIMNHDGSIRSWFGTVSDIHDKKTDTEWLIKSVSEMSLENKNRADSLIKDLYAVLEKYK